MLEAIEKFFNSNVFMRIYSILVPMAILLQGIYIGIYLSLHDRIVFNDKMFKKDERKYRFNEKSLEKEVVCKIIIGVVLMILLIMWMNFQINSLLSYRELWSN